MTADFILLFKNLMRGSAEENQIELTDIISHNFHEGDLLRNPRIKREDSYSETRKSVTWPNNCIPYVFHNNFGK